MLGYQSQQSSGLAYQLDKILKRMSKHLCVETTDSLVPLLLTTYLRQLVQKDAKIYLALVNYLLDQRKSAGGGDDSGTELELRDETDAFFENQQAVDEALSRYVKSEDS